MGERSFFFHPVEGHHDAVANPLFDVNDESFGIVAKKEGATIRGRQNPLDRYLHYIILHDFYSIAFCRRWQE